MPVTGETVFIPVPPEEVFDYLDDPAHLPVFDPTILNAELGGDGPVGVGTRVRGRNKILGQTFDWTVEVIEYERPAKRVVKSVEGPVSFTLSYTLTPEDGGTRVHYRNEAAEGLGEVFGAVPDASVGEVGGRQMRANLATLAEILTGRQRMQPRSPSA